MYIIVLYNIYMKIYFQKYTHIFFFKLSIMTHICNLSTLEAKVRHLHKFKAGPHSEFKDNQGYRDNPFPKKKNKTETTYSS